MDPKVSQVRDRWKFPAIDQVADGCCYLINNESGRDLRKPGEQTLAGNTKLIVAKIIGICVREQQRV